MAKVAVGGSRSIDSQEMAEGVLDQLLVDGDVILSGNAPGVDRMGEEYARKRGLEVKIIPSEWDKHGFKATMMRNEVLLKSSDFVICFWDGQSEGTRHMLDIAKRARKLLAEVRPDGYLKLFLNPRGR
jgi:predicted Rossmann fold nucleotide-binding protein DprA/Smf involved in DNA uptake